MSSNIGIGPHNVAFDSKSIPSRPMISDAANMGNVARPCQPTGAPLASLRAGRKIDPATEIAR
jgi:hypothetical protein